MSNCSCDVFGEICDGHTCLREELKRRDHEYLAYLKKKISEGNLTPKMLEIYENEVHRYDAHQNYKQPAVAQDFYDIMTHAIMTETYKVDFVKNPPKSHPKPEEEPRIYPA